MNKTILIDYLPESALRYRTGWTVVAVDVIRATTMAVTAVDLGRLCYPVNSVSSAFLMAERLPNPLLAGELNGVMPPGFHMNNSPAELADRDDVERPLILLSSSGTRLILNARGCDQLYLACFRNFTATARQLVKSGVPRIALLGAGSRGEFREEDRICCAWIGAQLSACGYTPEDETTVNILSRWGRAKASDCLVSASVRYLQESGQLKDLHFVLGTVDDLDEAFVLENDGVAACRKSISKGLPAGAVA